MMLNHRDKKWKEFFIEHASKIKTSARDTSLIVDLSIPEAILQRSISNFVSGKVSICCFFSTTTQSISFLHSQSDLEGGILASSKVVAFNGFCHTAFPVIIQNTNITKTTDVRVPNLDSLIQMESLADIIGLESAADTNSELLSTLPFMVIPPFLWATAIELRNRCPANVLLAF